jgi:hypothetical protein
MSGTVFIGPQEYEVTEVTAAVRWLRRDFENGWFSTVLQQRHTIRTMSGGTILSIREEWRDVPIFTEEEKPK